MDGPFKVEQVTFNGIRDQKKKHMGVSKNRGKTPKWMVKIMENPIKMDDLGVPLFSAIHRITLRKHQVAASFWWISRPDFVAWCPRKPNPAQKMAKDTPQPLLDIGIYLDVPGSWDQWFGSNWG